MISDKDRVLLFNPVGTVHAKKIELFRKFMPGWRIRTLYNPRHPWFSDRKMCAGPDIRYFRNDRVPPGALDGVKAVILFSAQPRAPHCDLIREAAIRSIPVIAIEEVYQMALEQGYVNEYLLPVDHLFAASDYDREKFIRMGLSEKTVETTGCVLGYEYPNPSDPDQKNRLKKALGVSSAKKVATLSLAYFTLSGETPDVRMRLLRCVSDGLPDDYELLVKPHPGERDDSAERSVRKYAPRARIADRYMPVDRILDITDVLFNRGNSQVIMDALRRGIPVLAVPMGRYTIFDEFMLKELIINDSSDIPKALGIIAEKRMSLYETIFNSLMAIRPKEAVERAVMRIEEIADKGILVNPEDRMIELSLFWSCIGYNRQALRTMSKARCKDYRSGLIKSVKKLIVCGADRDDIELLREWGGKRSCIELVLQSLWIKTLYVKGPGLHADDKEWLMDYPPRMNREFFLNYAYMLYWCYARSGFHPEKRLLAGRLFAEYGSLKEVNRLIRHTKTRSVCYDKILFWEMRIRHSVKLMLKNIVWDVTGE